MVVVVGGVGDVSVPQRVVGKDEGSLVHERQDVLVGLHVRALVAVDESHVEHYAQLGRQLVGVADDEVYLVRHFRTLYPGAREVLHLVVYLESPQLAVFLQSHSHADGAISGEGSHFEDVLRSDHTDEHLEELSLQVS